ncbi:MAG: hypothetical protein SAK42_02905, partial [Oscillatoria sp. PMC 1076.18]|nr:hypothetical protein [Oscillatoria sp. PMC 1076.18]
EASPAIVSEEDDWLDSEQETDAPDAENGDLVDSPAIISEEDNWIDSEPEIDSPNAENSDLNDFLDSNLGDDDWGDLDGEIPSSDADFNDSPATNLGDDDWGDLLDLQDEEETETSAPDEVESIAESEEWKDILDLQDEEAEDAEVSPFANELTPENELASDGQITTEEDAEESPFANELTPENELASDGQITTEEDAEESPFANELTPEATDLSLNENEAEYSPFAQPNLNVDDTESNLLPEDELEDWGEMTSGELSAGEAFAEIESLNLDSEENDWENWVVEEEPSELNNIPQLEVDPLEAFNLEEDEEWEDWIVEEETNSATNLTPETATGDRSLPNLDTLDWEDNDDWEDFEEVSQGTTSPPPASISTSDDDWDELTIDIEAQDVAELSQENESNLGSDFSSFDDDELRKGLTAAKYQKRPSQAEDDANQDSTPGG